jgi:hypothetical protein
MGNFATNNNFVNILTMIIILNLESLFEFVISKTVCILQVFTANTRLYWLFLISWSLYGVAAFLPYVPKNIMHNVLDLFSKNLVGLILFYTIWKNSIQ